MIPVNTPLLDGNEAKYLAECIETGWISSEGPFVRRFEQAFASKVGRHQGISCSSGSAALDIAVAATGIKPGDEVIMPTFTIISPALSVIRAGAMPVLVDSDPVTWNMDVPQIESKITDRTKAILVVHIYGLPVDMNPVLDIAKRHNLVVIEDAAEMHGQMYAGRPCGSFGDVSTFSFYANKHVTCGEGGMVLTDNAEIADRCRSLRNLCFQPERRFVHEELGWNYRMTNLQAAVGLAQLESLDRHVTRKREIGDLYDRLLRDIQGLQRPLPATDYASNIYWVFGVMVDSRVDVSSTEIMSRLGQSGIGTRPFFWPLHRQPVFQKQGMFQGENYPHADHLAHRGFYLPSGLGLRDADIETVVDAVRQALD